MAKPPTFTYQQATYHDRWLQPGFLYNRTPEAAIRKAWLLTNEHCYPIDYPKAYFFSYHVETVGDTTTMYRAGRPVLKVTKVKNVTA